MGYEIDSFPAALARINVFLNTKRIDATQNIHLTDSLKNGLHGGFDIMMSNIPFGVKGITEDSCCQEVKQFGEVGGKGSEPHYFALIMGFLNPNGRAGIIVPDGFLYNTKPHFRRIREILLRYFCVTKVVKTRGKFFLNTNTEPDVIYFTRKSPDETVKFTHLTLLDGKMVETERAIIPTLELINNPNISLCCDDYVREDPRQGLPFKEWYHLSDLTEVKKGKFNSNDMSREGDVPFFSCAVNNPIGFHDECCFDHPEYILFADSGGVKESGEESGLGKVYYLKGKSATTTHVCGIIVKPEIPLLTKFLYYYLNGRKRHLVQLTRPSTTIRNTRISDIKGFLVPMPSMDIQEKIVKKMDSEYGDGILEMEERIRYLKSQGEFLFLAATNQ